MMTDEVENIENAETSVRAVIIGTCDRIIEREVDRSVADSPAKYDIGTPGRSSETEDEVGIEDGPARASGLRFSTPERNHSTKRDVNAEDDTMGGTTNIGASLGRHHELDRQDGRGRRVDLDGSHIGS